MHRPYRTSREAYQASTHQDAIKRRGRFSFIRRSTVINFLAILLIFGAVFALHSANKRFGIEQPPEENASAAAPKAEAVTRIETAPSATVVSQEAGTATPNAQESAEAAEPSDSDASEPTTDVAEAGDATNEAAPADGADAEAAKGDVEAPAPAQAQTAAQETSAEKSAAEATAAAPAEDMKAEAAPEPEPAGPPKRTYRSARRVYPRRSRWNEDRSFGVEQLDNESTRRSYLDANKSGAGSDRAAAPTGLETYSTYTMPDEGYRTTTRTYAYDDLDGEQVRRQYRKENEKRSTVDLR